MNYAEQSRFFGRFRLAAMLFVVAVVAIFSWIVVADYPRTSSRGLVVSTLLVIALSYGLVYLPLYLRLSIETRKRYAWGLRVRYVLVGLLGVATFPATAISRSGGAGSLVTSVRPWLAWIGGILLALASIAIARAHFRRNRDVVELPLVPALLLVGELALLMMLTEENVATNVGLVTGLALAGAAYCVTSSGVWQAAGIVAVCVADGLMFATVAVARGAAPSPSTLLLPIVAIFAAWVLTRAADRRHARNVGQTVEELASFALVTPEHASEMLATSTGILARNWNDNRPLGPDAVARWYSENSEYYLYDLAQFHLAYKHIAFMCDIVALTRGRVLDFGAGIGDLALELARLGHETTYFDVDGTTKAFAQWRSERDWIPVSFASELAQVEGEFDTIVSLDVFEHLAEPEPVIESLVDRLAPGGRAIFTAYFGPTKAHPMHFDHDLDLGAFLEARGLENAKSFAMRHLRSEFLGKRGVLVFEKR